MMVKSWWQYKVELFKMFEALQVMISPAEIGPRLSSERAGKLGPEFKTDRGPLFTSLKV